MKYAQFQVSDLSGDLHSSLLFSLLPLVLIVLLWIHVVALDMWSLNVLSTYTVNELSLLSLYWSSSCLISSSSVLTARVFAWLYQSLSLTFLYLQCCVILVRTTPCNMYLLTVNFMLPTFSYTMVVTSTESTWISLFNNLHNKISIKSLTFRITARMTRLLTFTILYLFRHLLRM